MRKFERLRILAWTVASVFLPSVAMGKCLVFKDEGREVKLTVSKVSGPKCQCIDKDSHPSSATLTGACLVEGKIVTVDGSPLRASVHYKNVLNSKANASFVTTENKICRAEPGNKFNVKLRLRCKDVILVPLKDKPCTDPLVMSRCEYDLDPNIYADLAP